MTACRVCAAAVIVCVAATCADGAEDGVATSRAVAVPNSMPRPNIVLIVTDDQRPDTIRSMGNSVIETPHLDGLAARGTAFTRAYAGYPICHVSRVQLLTGCCAFKVLPQYPGGAIDSSLATLAGTLRAAGYHTCYTGKWHNDGHPTQRGYSTTSGLFSSGGAKDFTQPETDERGRPLTGYRGWTFKNTANDPELGKGIGLQPDNSRHVAEGAIQALRNAPVKLPSSYTSTSRSRMIHDTRWKLIRYPRIAREQLFDLQADPHEQFDLSQNAEHRQIREDLKQQLDQWCREHHDPAKAEFLKNAVPSGVPGGDTSE